MSLMHFLASTMFQVKSDFDHLPVLVQIRPSEDESTFRESIGGFEFCVSSYKKIRYSQLSSQLISAANEVPGQTRKPYVDYFFEFDVVNVFEQTLEPFHSGRKIQVSHLKIQNGHLIANFFYTTVLTGPEEEGELPETEALA